MTDVLVKKDIDQSELFKNQRERERVNQRGDSKLKFNGCHKYYYLILVPYKE